MYKFLITFLTLSISASLLAAEGFSSLEEQMTGKEFTAAGLDKLSDEELAALNAWVRAHSLATLDSPKAGAAVATSAAVPETQQDRRGFKAEKDENDRAPISSRIVGRFDGWDGQTVFKLENGMIWEQADKDKFWVKALDNPQVTIEPGMFGTWRLSVEGYNSNCRVERIQ